MAARALPPPSLPTQALAVSHARVFVAVQGDTGTLVKLKAQPAHQTTHQRPLPPSGVCRDS